MTDSWGNLKVIGDFHPKRRQVCSLLQKEAEIKLRSARYSDTSAKLQDLSPVLDDRTLLAELESVTTTTDLNMSLMKSEMRENAGVDAATLANNWGIRSEASKRMRLVTTKRGIRRMIHPSLTNRQKPMTGSYDISACMAQCLLTQCTQQSSPDKKTKQLRYFVLTLVFLEHFQ
jgi:hypothetical protein